MSSPSAPIFLVGVARSGTTLLALMLDSHSRIAIPHESHFIVPYYKQRGRLGDLRRRQDRLELVRRILAEPYVAEWDHRLEVADLDLDACTTLEATIEQLYMAYARRSDKDLWGDKTPSYITDLHVLNRMFPRCRFIHLVRDGRDVALSLVQQWWGPSDFRTAVAYWAERVSCARKMLGMLPDQRHIEIKFEELVAEPAGHLRRVTEFLGVDFQPAMLSAYQDRAARKVGPRIAAHHGNLTSPPSTSQAFKWQRALGRADQAIAHEVAGRLLAELGYPPGAMRHPLKQLRKAYHRLRESYIWRFRPPRSGRSTAGAR